MITSHARVKKKDIVFIYIYTEGPGLFFPTCVSIVPKQDRVWDNEERIWDLHCSLATTERGPDNTRVIPSTLLLWMYIYEWHTECLVIILLGLF